MKKAKRYRKHYHYIVSYRYHNHLYWSICDASTQPRATKIWYKFYFRNK